MRRPKILPEKLPGDAPADVLRCCGQQTLEAHCKNKSEAEQDLTQWATSSSVPILTEVSSGSLNLFPLSGKAQAERAVSVVWGTCLSLVFLTRMSAL